MAGQVAYRALKRCRVGRLREPGEVFFWEEIEPLPAHLERADKAEATAPACRTGAVSAAGFEPSAGNASAGLTPVGGPNAGQGADQNAGQNSAGAPAPKRRPGRPRKPKAAEGQGQKKSEMSGSGAPGVTPGDMGEGSPVPSHLVTSADIIKPV